MTESRVSSSQSFAPIVRSAILCALIQDVANPSLCEARDKELSAKRRGELKVRKYYSLARFQVKERTMASRCCLHFGPEIALRAQPN